MMGNQPNEILIAKALIAEMEYISAFAKKAQTCKRKSVGVSILDIVRDRAGRVIMDRLTKQHNGPAIEDAECNNEVGNCGCAHAEPRAVLDLMRRGWMQSPDRGKLILVSEYSPCTNCANVILDSGVIQVCVYEHTTKHDLRGLSLLQKGLECTLPLHVAHLLLSDDHGPGVMERRITAERLINRWLD